MDKASELRRLIIWLLMLVSDEETLRRIYDYVNQAYCNGK